MLNAKLQIISIARMNEEIYLQKVNIDFDEISLHIFKKQRAGNICI